MKGLLSTGRTPSSFSYIYSPRFCVRHKFTILPQLILNLFNVLNKNQLFEQEKCENLNLFLYININGSNLSDQIGAKKLLLEFYLLTLLPFSNLRP